MKGFDIERTGKEEIHRIMGVNHGRDLYRGEREGRGGGRE